MGPQVEGADIELRAPQSEGAPGHVRLGVPSNLPAELSTFVGRVNDLERGARLLGESRLVTFTGAGGCGKTRLARQVAARVAERFPGGAWWVELASLADGALVTERVARTLGLQTGETEAVTDYFADRKALLLLDNCEHIAESVAEFVTAVLRGAGLIHVLATTGIPWAWEWETTWRVPSLAVPPQAADPATLGPVRRGAAVPGTRPATTPGRGTERAMAQICRRLDGIPLALELAAARVGGVTIDRLMDELNDTFLLLTRGSRAGLARHRTLLASVEWSCQLPGCHVNACCCAGWASSLVAGPSKRPGGWPGSRLWTQRRCSICWAAWSTNHWPSWTNRDATGCWRPSAPTRGRRRPRPERPRRWPGHHLAWTADFTQRLEKDLERAAPECLDVVERELPNIRAALDLAASVPDPDHNGLRLMTALAFFWTQRGYAAEGADYSLRVLAGDPAAPAALRARARWARRL